MPLFLKDIIDNIYLETQDIDSIFRNKKRYNIARFAKQGLQKLNMTFATNLKAMNFEVPTSCKVYKPDGYLSFVRAYLLNCDGTTLEIRRNENIPDDIRHYLVDCDGTILSDCTGQIYDTCLVCNDWSIEEKSCCEECNGTGKYDKNSSPFILALEKYKDSWVKINSKLDYFQFSSDLEGQKMVIEYLSDSVFETEECLVKIDEDLEECLDYYIKFKLLENGIETMQQAQMFKRNFKQRRDKLIADRNELTRYDIYQAFLKH